MMEEPSHRDESSSRELLRFSLHICYFYAGRSRFGHTVETASLHCRGEEKNLKDAMSRSAYTKQQTFEKQG